MPFYLMPTRADLIRDHLALISDIRSQLAADQLPVAVTLDTLNRSLAGSESSDEDMSAYIQAADAIREAFNCAVVIVHHCGIDGSRPRGHTSLTGAVEAQCAIKRDAASQVILTVEHMKDGPEDDVIASTLESVEVGTDDYGDPITSCVVVPADPGEVAARRLVYPTLHSWRSRRSARLLVSVGRSRLHRTTFRRVSWLSRSTSGVRTLTAWVSAAARLVRSRRHSSRPPTLSWYETGSPSGTRSYGSSTR